MPDIKPVAQPVVSVPLLDKDKGSGHKPGLSHSPLARPETFIHQLAAKVQEYWYFPNPDPLYAILGTIAADMLKGDPVWLMVIGPPSSLKTSLIRSLMTVPKVHDASDITSLGALLSGVKKDDHEAGATGGLLRKIGQRGVLLLEDYTSSVINGLGFEARSQILNAFRLIYNGRWTRDMGTGGGKSLVWTGKIGLIAGATLEIDRVSLESAALGERWVCYRLPDSDGYGESRKAAQNRDPDGAREDIRGWVQSFFDAVGLEFPCSPDCNRKVEGDKKTHHEHVVEVEARELEDQELNRLVAMSSLVTRVRSSVPRDQRNYEIIGQASVEMPARLTTTLGQLYLGLERIGLPVGERWRVISKVAIDSSAQLKMQTVLLLAGVVHNSGEERKLVWQISELKRRLKCGQGTITRAIEDLGILGVVEYSPGKPGRVARNGTGDHEQAVEGGARLSEWARKQLRTGWGAGNSSEYQI